MDDIDLSDEATMSPREADRLILRSLYMTYLGMALGCLGVPFVLAVPIVTTIWYALRHASREGRAVATVTLVSVFLSVGGGFILLAIALTVSSLPLAAIGALTRP